MLIIKNLKKMRGKMVDSFWAKLSLKHLWKM